MEHAVVVGGSMAGLLCARVLADHCERVTILERDSFPAAVENRRGVPQGRHTHGLLASGRQVLERFFPGISEELVQAGAVPGDVARDCRWFFGGACLAKFTSGMQGLLMSRPFLEAAVRSKVLALPNLWVRENTIVDGLASTADNARVIGVRIGNETLAADLVVDTTGRGSHSPQWLESMGYPKALEERVEVALAYTTRFFRRRPQHLDGDGAAIIPPTPEGKRGGVMLAQEGNRWTLTLIGHFGQAAPPELEGFIEYARTLPAPYIYDVIRDAEPLGEPATARFPASARRRYEKLRQFPEGYLVFGDAISSFNPIYGQGMSVAALEAVELDRTLAEGENNLARRFFRRAAKVVDIPWAVAVGNDLRMKETIGPRNAGVKVINWYLSKLHNAAHHDPVPALAFHRVGNLLAPPPSVLHPRVAWRVLLGNLRPRLAARAADQAMHAAAGK
ncbi:MAG TPA: FAD-dependent monooxygenase [Bryobacteraceae bacterium]|nr:FAD-dependent monooxygenase [Bryobacteraceae bacterium]